MRRRETRHNEEWVTYPDGRKALLDTMKTPYWGPSGELIGVLGISCDITLRKRAEEALLKSSEEFRAMFELASIGMAQCDPQTGQWLRVNQKRCRITGYTAAEMLGMKVADITHPADREKDSGEFRRVVGGEVPDYRLEKRYVR